MLHYIRDKCTAAYEDKISYFRRKVTYREENKQKQILKTSDDPSNEEY